MRNSLSPYGILIAHTLPAALLLFLYGSMLAVIRPLLSVESVELWMNYGFALVGITILATTYAVSAGDEDAAASALGGKLAADWSLPTALAFLAWFVFAPQCLSTIAVARRETNGWKWPAFMLLYLFALAYTFAGITYWSALALGL